jgi:hypothetical protein
MTQYNPEAVDKAIASSNRTFSGKISSRESKLIHALLKGRNQCPTTPPKLQSNG